MEGRRTLFHGEMSFFGCSKGSRPGSHKKAPEKSPYLSISCQKKKCRKSCHESWAVSRSRQTLQLLGETTLDAGGGTPPPG